jgi:hypothetical protein
LAARDVEWAAGVALLGAQDDKAKKILTLIDTKGRGAREKIHRLPITPRMRGALDAGALQASALHIDTVRFAAGDVLRKMNAQANDIRRSVESHLSELGVSRETRGVLLSHGRGGVQARHYEASDRLDEKLGALKIWEQWLFGQATKNSAKKKTRKINSSRST